MKKLGKRLLIVLLIGVVLFGGYYLFLRPTGFTSRTELVTSFFTEIHEDTACTTHFNPETESYCETFTTLFDGETITVDAVNEHPTGATVTVSSGGESTTFTVTFITEQVTGVRGFLNGTYYRIDTIE